MFGFVLLCYGKGLFSIYFFDSIKTITVCRLILYMFYFFFIEYCLPKELK